jgi:hypothetical protein
LGKSEKDLHSESPFAKIANGVTEWRSVSDLHILQPNSSFQQPPHTPINQKAPQSPQHDATTAMTIKKQDNNYNNNTTAAHAATNIGESYQFITTSMQKVCSRSFAVW